ncbi:MAG TPA: diacylglycerol kinase family protein [Chthoniobacterales bacterium]
MRSRLKSFVYAFRGIGQLFLTQPNARIHAVAMLGVIAAGLGFHVTAVEWCLLVLSIVAVLGAEAMNSAVETLADEVSEEKRERIGLAKDLAAGAVLLISMGAAIVGIVIFGRHLWFSS